HGGQVKFEIVDHSVSPARLITPFVAGLYRLPMSSLAGAAPASNGVQKAALYVNRGLGTLGFPVRIGVPPEITLLTLRRASRIEGRVSRPGGTPGSPPSRLDRTTTDLRPTRSIR